MRSCSSVQTPRSSAVIEQNEVGESDDDDELADVLDDRPAVEPDYEVQGEE